MAFCTSCSGSSIKQRVRYAVQTKQAGVATPLDGFLNSSVITYSTQGRVCSQASKEKNLSDTDEYDTGGTVV